MNKIITLALLCALTLFNAPAYADGCYLTPYDDVQAKLLDIIKSSTETIRLCIYAINDPEIVDALIASKKKGVDVQIITDLSQSKMVGQKAAVIKLLDAGIPVYIGQSSRHGLVHAKFIVCDGMITAEGSYNYTIQAPQQDNSFNVVTHPGIASQYNVFWNFIKMDMR